MVEARLLVEAQPPAPAGQPEHYVGPLVNADAALFQLLADRLARPPADAYRDELMAAIKHRPSRSSPATTETDLLSPPELPVLPYLATRLTSREIAGNLYVPMNTLKTHLENTYGRLDVSSRAKAVKCAHQHGLL